MLPQIGMISCCLHTFRLHDNSNLNEAIEHVLMNERFECGKIQRKTEVTINSGGRTTKQENVSEF